MMKVYVLALTTLALVIFLLKTSKDVLESTTGQASKDTAGQPMVSSLAVAEGELPTILHYQNHDSGRSQAFNTAPYALNGDHHNVVLFDIFHLAQGQDRVYQFLFSASFSVFQVITVDLNLFYVAGWDAQGFGVIEKWEKVTPNTPGAVLSVDLNGSPPAAKVYPILMTRLYTVPTMCVLRAFGMDPQERFAYVVHNPASGGATQLAKLPLPPGPPVTVVSDSSILPQLAFCQAIYPMDHKTLGRVWTLEGGNLQLIPDIDWTLLFDPLNLGVIDSFEEMDGESYGNNYGAHSDWVVDHIYHFK